MAINAKSTGGVPILAMVNWINLVTMASDMAVMMRVIFLVRAPLPIMALTKRGARARMLRIVSGESAAWISRTSRAEAYLRCVSRLVSSSLAVCLLALMSVMVMTTPFRP